MSSFPGVERPGREADCSRPPSARVSYTPNPPGTTLRSNRHSYSHIKAGCSLGAYDRSKEGITVCWWYTTNGLRYCGWTMPPQLQMCNDLLQNSAPPPPPCISLSSHVIKVKSCYRRLSLCACNLRHSSSFPPTLT